MTDQLRETTDEKLLPTAPAADGAAAQEPAPPRRNWLVALPLVLFGGLAAIFLYQLLSGHDPKQIPSVLIGKTAPETQLPELAGMTGPDGKQTPGLDLSGFGDGRPVLVNVFASWCGPCRVEHPLLMELGKDKRFKLVAINYKDKPDNARAFLETLGNPYAAIGVDQKGSATIDWGVYGVPESFLVAPDGEILYKQTGPFTRESIDAGLMPAVTRAMEREPDGRAPTS